MHEEAENRGAFVFKKNDILTSPFRWLVFASLSARSRDENTYRVCKSLFRTADTPQKVLSLGEKRLGGILRPIGFYRGKTKRMAGMCRMLMEDFGGRVPGSMEKLILLPGVGRKTANLILNKVFGKDALAVDVHVHRISNRLGWVKTSRVEETERELMRLLPKEARRIANKAMVGYGQTVCLPRNPKCDECRLKSICKRVGVE